MDNNYLIIKGCTIALLCYFMFPKDTKMINLIFYANVFCLIHIKIENLQLN